MSQFLPNKTVIWKKKKKTSQKKIRERIRHSMNLFFFFWCSKEKGQNTKETMKRSGDIINKVLDMNDNEQKHSCLLFI